MTPFIPPLMRSGPQRLSPTDVDAFARRTGWIDDDAVIHAESSSVDCLALPWWPGVDLLVARDPGWSGAAPVAAWLRDKHLHRLTGESRPIHTMNARLRPQIDDATVLPYLGFFCLFVSGKDGPFIILEAPEDAAHIGATIDPQLRAKLQPARIVARQDDGHRCEAAVWFGDDLFQSHFLVRAEGTVEMVDDQVLAKNIGRCDITYRFTAGTAAA
ncbi:MAG: hypothetical protein JSR59_02190 [Proteobacteria bacterium]|nr:hypothetical protein [Pseudomonadota bacterium]